MSAITIDQAHKNSKIMFRKRYQAQFGQIFKALLEIPNESLRKQITDVINEFDSNAAPKTFVAQETQTAIDSGGGGGEKSVCVQCSCAKRSTQSSPLIVGLQKSDGVAKKTGDPQNIYTKSIIRQLDRATQTTSSDLIEIREHKSSGGRSGTEKQSSTIISGKEVKLGRAKRVNVPHVKNDQAPVNGSRSARIISAPKAVTKKYQKITPKTKLEKSEEVNKMMTLHRNFLLFYLLRYQNDDKPHVFCVAYQIFNDTSLRDAIFVPNSSELNTLQVQQLRSIHV